MGLKFALDNALAARTKAVKKAYSLYHAWREDETNDALHQAWQRYEREVLIPAHRVYNDAYTAYWTAHNEINGLHRNN